jgi:uncharacterized protein YutE (UPF0331/DUF86 family)
MSAETTESKVLQRLVPDLQAEGYEVYIHPNRALLPTFLKSYEPDAIGLRDDHNLAIEVTRKSPDAQKRVERIVHLFKGRTDWELRIVWITPATSTKTMQLQTVSTIRKRLKEIRELADGEHYGPALLLAWATVEATARLLASKHFERPQTPGRLVQVLASEGILTPTEADDLRALADKRNKFIHGELQTRITRAEIERIASILGTMISVSKTAAIES